LLQQQDIGLGPRDPPLDLLEPCLQRVHVPRGDAHSEKENTGRRGRREEKRAPRGIWSAAASCPRAHASVENRNARTGDKKISSAPSSPSRRPRRPVSPLRA